MHTDNWPSSYSPAPRWGLESHAHRLVKIVPQPHVEWLGRARGEERAWLCPSWGCALQSVVREQWERRTRQ